MTFDLPMVTQTFTLVALFGALLAVPYAIYAGRSSGFRRVFAIGLVVASLVYVVLAVLAGSLESLWLELGGVVLFGALALVGTRWSPFVLAAGWGLHVAWDLLLHPIHVSGYAPWWYPVLCIGFDFVVAGFIVGTVASRHAHRKPAR